MASRLLWILILTGISLSCASNWGEKVCTKEVLKTFKIYRMNSFTHKLVSEEKVRRNIVFVCCEGYRERSRNKEFPNCVPICMPACGYGYCAQPNSCICYYGYELSEGTCKRIGRRRIETTTVPTTEFERTTPHIDARPSPTVLDSFAEVKPTKRISLSRSGLVRIRDTTTIPPSTSPNSIYESDSKTTSTYVNPFRKFQFITRKPRRETTTIVTSMSPKDIEVNSSTEKNVYVTPYPMVKFFRRHFRHRATTSVPFESSTHHNDLRTSSTANLIPRRSSKLENLNSRSGLMRIRDTTTIPPSTSPNSIYESDSKTSPTYVNPFRKFQFITRKPRRETTTIVTSMSPKDIEVNSSTEKNDFKTLVYVTPYPMVKFFRRHFHHRATTSIPVESSTHHNDLRTSSTANLIPRRTSKLENLNSRSGLVRIRDTTTIPRSTSPNSIYESHPKTSPTYVNPFRKFQFITRKPRRETTTIVTSMSPMDIEVNSSTEKNVYVTPYPMVKFFRRHFHHRATTSIPFESSTHHNDLRTSSTANFIPRRSSKLENLNSQEMDGLEGTTETTSGQSPHSKMSSYLDDPFGHFNYHPPDTRRTSFYTIPRPHDFNLAICVMGSCTCQFGHQVFQQKFCRPCEMGSQCKCRNGYAFDSRTLQCKPLCNGVFDGCIGGTCIGYNECSCGNDTENMADDYFRCVVKEAQIFDIRRIDRRWYSMLLIIPVVIVAVNFCVIIKRWKSSKANRLKAQKHNFPEVRYFNNNNNLRMESKYHEAVGDSLGGTGVGQSGALHEERVLVLKV